MKSPAIALARPTSMRLADLTLILGGSLLMTLGAKCEVPFWPVPMTLQVLVTFVLAGLFGPWRAGAMVGLYLVEGALGLPVFANSPARGIGLAYMVGPTGGYLLGFLVAAFASGAWIYGKSRSFVSMLLAMLGGLGVIYLLGAAWLAKFVGIEASVMLGIVPFLLGDLLKVLLAASMVTAVSRVRGTV